MKTKLTMKNYLIEFLNIAMIFILWSAFFAGGIIYISNNLFSFSLEEYRPFLWLISGVIFSSIYIFYRKKIYLKNEIWELNNNILTKGDPVHTTFDLNKIEYMVFGLPKPKWMIFFTKFSFTSSQKIIQSLYTASLTIKFTDNTYLILNLFQIGNGLELTNQILMDYQDKIIDNYIFTEEEKNILKIRSSNRLLRIK